VFVSQANAIALFPKSRVIVERKKKRPLWQRRENQQVTIVLAFDAAQPQGWEEGTKKGARELGGHAAC
jgi:hypothetical protein